MDAVIKNLYCERLNLLRKYQDCKSHEVRVLLAKAILHIETAIGALKKC